MIPLDIGTIARAASSFPPYQGRIKGGHSDALSSTAVVRRVSTDSRDVQPGDLFVALRGPNFDGNTFIPEALSKGAIACIGDRGVTHAEPVANRVLGVDDPLAALGRLAAYYRNEVIAIGTTVIAVTGSNGKTTTKCMIDHVLRGSFKGRPSPKSFNNAIGVPLTLLSVEADDRYVVVEVGSNSPGEIAALASMASPNVAVITSIGEAHLEGLGDLHAVAAEKTSILRHVRPSGFGVVNVDRPEILPYLAAIPRTRVISFGVDAAAQLRVTRRRADLEGTTFELEGRYEIELPMPGPHHATNAAATFAVARWFGVSPQQIIERLRTFQPPEGRTRRLQVNGVTLVDDAYNANPSSVGAAIETLRAATSARRILVLGDMLELGENSDAAHLRVLRWAVDAGLEIVLAVGRRSTQAALRIGSGAVGTRVLSCLDSDAANELLDGLVGVGDTVWVKGSRGMHLDRTVAHLRARLESVPMPFVSRRETTAA